MSRISEQTDMPNRDFHQTVGMVAGGTYAAYRAHSRYKDRTEPAVPVMAEAIGGVLGGYVGAALPDIIDPPTSPNHRHFGHGVVPVVGAVALTADHVLQLQEHLRTYADQLEANRWQLNNDFDRFMNSAVEVFARVLAGSLNGAIGGYASHLVLDSCTPRGLPLISRDL